MDLMQTVKNTAARFRCDVFPTFRQDINIVARSAASSNHHARKIINSEQQRPQLPIAAVTRLQIRTGNVLPPSGKLRYSA